MDIKIIKLTKNAKIPEKGSLFSAGYDIFTPENLILQPLSTTRVKLGIQIELPREYFGLLKDRSSVAYNKEVFVVGGVIDSDYRGEVAVVLHNASKQIQEFSRGERICQMLILKMDSLSFIETSFLSPTSRGAGGFGSTGK